jgi:hypothetical protein
LEHGPSTLHLRSFYKPQLERHFEHFPESQIHVILFEEFVRNTGSVTDQLYSFLGISQDVERQAGEAHANKSTVPRSLRLQLVLNYISEILITRYGSHLPGERSKNEEEGLVREKVRDILFHLRRWNRKEGEYPPMSQTTRDCLGKVYARENRGLSELIGKDLSEYWPFMNDY